MKGELGHPHTVWRGPRETGQSHSEQDTQGHRGKEWTPTCEGQGPLPHPLSGQSPSPNPQVLLLLYSLDLFGNLEILQVALTFLEESSEETKAPCCRRPPTCLGRRERPLLAHLARSAALWHRARVSSVSCTHSGRRLPPPPPAPLRRLGKQSCAVRGRRGPFFQNWRKVWVSPQE